MLVLGLPTAFGKVIKIKYPRTFKERGQVTNTAAVEITSTAINSRGGQ